MLQPASSTSPPSVEDASDQLAQELQAEEYSGSPPRDGGSPAPPPAPMTTVRAEAPPARQLVSLGEAIEQALVRLAASCERELQVRTLTSKCRSICFNLSDAKNPELRSRLLGGELSPAALVRLSSTEMAGEGLRKQRQEWHAMRLKCAVRPERSLVAGSGYRCDLYRCDRCESRQTRVHRAIRAGQRQVDRARTYITCIVCNHRWEEGGA